MAIDVADVVSEFGDYYKAEGQSVADLRTDIRIMNESDELFVNIPTNDTIVRGGKVTISPVLQAFQKSFTRAGDTEITARTIELEQLKIDWEENPSELEGSWLGFLSDKDLDRSQWPFVRYMIEEHIMKQAKVDWETNGIFSGVKSSITPGTPKFIQGAINGIQKQIQLAYAAETLTPISLGAVPTDPVQFVEYMEEFASGIPEHVQPFLQQIAMSKTLAKRFRTGMRTKYNMNYAQTDIATIIDTDLKVKGYASHAGSTRIWTTVRGNASLYMKKPGYDSVFKVEQAKRMVSVYTDFWKGLGFWMPEYVYTNDVELS